MAAALTDVQLGFLHDHLGTDADEDNLQERYDRLLDLNKVVVEVLERRLADLLSTPASFSVGGDYSQSTAENIRALTDKLAQFAGGSLTGVSRVRMILPVPRDAR